MTVDSMPMHLVVVAGGSGERLGHVDKALCVVDGVRLIDRALDLPVVGRRIVVRPPGRHPIDSSPDGQSVEVVSEQPAGGGPTAGIAAAMTFLAAPHGGPSGASAPAQILEGDRQGDGLVAILAADHLAPLDEVVAALLADLAAHPESGVAVAAPDGKPQWLTCVWRADALTGAIADLGDPNNAPVRKLVGLGSPVMVDVPRVPSLDSPGHLVGEPQAGPLRLGVAGPMSQRKRVASALGEGLGWTALDVLDPRGEAATALAPEGLVDHTAMEPTSGAARWVVVTKPESPLPNWAWARLVPLTD